MRRGTDTSSVRLKRAITLPWLVFYGVGVTIGAGIFALVGVVLELAGDKAPLAFLFAGAIAGVTGVSYALMIRIYPRAGGEAVFVNRGLGALWAQIAGFGVVATGIVSSAVISLAFAGYIQALLPLPNTLLVIMVVAGLSAIACYGVRESVLFAALVTLLELGTLLVVVAFGLPLLGDVDAVLHTLSPTADLAILTGILSSSVLAFFAFIGFEDIVNMCEETREAETTVPKAIYWTLGITMLVYVVLAIIAVLAGDREAIVSSSAPMARLFETVSGYSGKPIAAAATVAMINGVLVQIVMASRVLYGMANEGIAPAWFAEVNPQRQTPVRATVFVAIVIICLALVFPLVRLAEVTSLVTLLVFSLVNLALFALGRAAEEGRLHRFRYWGLAGAGLCLAIALFQIATGLLGGH